MLKNLIIRVILISFFLSSVMSIYRQIIIVRGAQSSVILLQSKIVHLSARNNALQQAIK